MSEFWKGGGGLVFIRDNKIGITMLIFTKIILTILVIIWIANIAELMGKLDKTYASYIVYIGLILQFIMLIYMVIFIITKRNIFKKGIKIIRHKFDNTYIKGNTDILSESVTTTNPRKPSILQVYVAVKDLKEPPDFGIILNGIILNGRGREEVKINDMKKRLLNISVGIVDNLSTFRAEIVVRPNENVNFQFKTDTNIKSFCLEELYIP